MQDSKIGSQTKTTILSPLGQNKGQLIVEYILLIVVVVMIATLLQSRLVGRGAGGVGIIISKWSALTTLVGQDMGD